MQQLTDTQIITFLQSGKESLEDRACRSLYQQYYGLIESLVIKNGAGKTVTKDIFQEALIVLWNMVRRPNFKLASALKTLLYSISHNLLRNKLRTKGRTENLQAIHQTIPIDESFLDTLFLTEKHNLLLQILKTMGADCQKVLRLYYFQQLSMKKIQAAFGDKSDAVTKNRKSRCLQRLRDHVLSNEQYVANLR